MEIKNKIKNMPASSVFFFFFFFFFHLKKRHEKQMYFLPNIEHYYGWYIHVCIPKLINHHTWSIYEPLSGEKLLLLLVRTTKTHISLRARAVWSASLLFAFLDGIISVGSMYVNFQGPSLFRNKSRHLVDTPTQHAH